MLAAVEPTITTEIIGAVLGGLILFLLTIGIFKLGRISGRVDRTESDTRDIYKMIGAMQQETSGGHKRLRHDVGNVQQWQKTMGERINSIEADSKRSLEMALSMQHLPNTMTTLVAKVDSALGLSTDEIRKLRG